MSDVVIRAEGLGKKYLIGHERETSWDNTFRDTLVSATRRMRRSAADLIRGRQLVVGDEVEEFWALKGVDFEIRRGDVVGIIGRNGAGKSTLLKILSRITEPTEGKVTIDGRVASLLEVGTGFHPELSGRENIFLNGSILGMTRREIQSKFDEIVDFAGVEKFIDTPVKRYSSGMKVRLGFSVAAHLEPEILIVDEVLAVGDAEFQKKCLGKMRNVASCGRTVLFVSHNMAAVQELCESAINLRSGRAEEKCSTRAAISSYYGISNQHFSFRSPEVIGASFFEDMSIVSLAGDGNTQLFTDDELVVHIKIGKGFPPGASIGVRLNDEVGRDILHFSDEFRSSDHVGRRAFCIPKNLLRPGTYIISTSVFKRNVQEYEPLTPRLSFRLEPRSYAYVANYLNWRGAIGPNFIKWIA